MRTLAAQLVRSLPSPNSLRTDGDLLAGFLNHGAEDDFAELVRRHGPLVWGACRRALPDPADSEDAFQATFLVLLRRGRKLTNYPTIGPWLHKVAAWTARNFRRRNARRLARQSALPEHIPSPTLDADLPLDIDAALLSLPEKFRSPIVLCHLLGYSRADAAERLGCAEGTLSAWLSRGLARLRARFGGLDPAKPLGIAALAVPTVLSTSVVRAAVGARLAAATTAAVSSTVSQVVEGVIRMFWIKKATAASMAMCVVFALGVSVGMSGHVVEGVAGGQEKSAAKQTENGFLKEYFKALNQDIADAQKRLMQVEEVLLHAQHGVEHIKKKIKLAEESGKYSAEQKLDDLITLSRFQSSRDDAIAEARLLKDRLDKLIASKVQADKPQPKSAEAELANLDRQIVDLQVELHLLREEQRGYAAKGNAAKADELEAKAKDIQARCEKLAHERRLLAKVMRVFPTLKPGHLELTVRGTAAMYQFALREFDAAGKEIGTVAFADSMKHPAMLAKVLARTRADTSAPTELRVLASPPTALGGGPHAALKACDAAGYKTVKFTGYVVAGGFAQELKIDDKEEKPGYKRYDGVERKTTELMKEIEDGMRTF